MRAGDRSTLAVMFSVTLATFTALPLTQDRSYLPISWLVIAVIGLVSLALRRSRIGGSGVLGVQVLLLATTTVGLSVVLTPPDTIDVTMPWFERYPALWAAGIEHMRTQGSPMDPNSGVALIFVTVIALVLVMTDLLVSGVHRPAWAIAPPATLFLVPALGLGSDTGVANFALIAVGYLAVLVAEGLNTTARWTRGLSADSARGFRSATPVVWRAAGLLAVPAVLAAVLLGVALPTLALPGFGFGSGQGGSGPLQLTDPTLDLRRNLNQPDDRTVIEYTTDQPGGSYLRMASLPELSAAGWTNVQIRLTAGTEIGAIPGVGTEPAERRRTTIRVLDFGSQYLPSPYAPRRVEIDGDWRFDANSLVVVNADNRPQDLRRTTYTVESAEINPDADELAATTAGTPADSATTGAIPRDLPDSLIRLSERVTAGLDTDAAKAAAIQAYLRSSRFQYDVRPQPGTGYQALENFLLRDHRGYCEQFASAMAMMARVNGIPSRVSVGFLPGDRDGDQWRVSIRDMHAWPELYFAGYGWVRYEPTPASVTGTAPSWTVRADDPEQNQPTAEPSAQPSTETQAPSDAPAEAPIDQTETGQAGLAGRVGRLALTGLGGLLGLAILAAPATLRIRRRSRRFVDDAAPVDRVEAAWAEIRDTVDDYGRRWPTGSPRHIGAQIGQDLDRPEAESMGRVATLVERARYSRELGPDQVTESLPELTDRIRHGLAAPQPRSRRLLAFLFPRSIFRRAR